MHKYKNISKSELSVIGVGLVEAGGEITTEHIIENPNFEYLGEEDNPASVNGVEQRPQSGAVTEAERVEVDNGQPTA